MVGRFLSPDPYVQAPDFSQSFNRYSYAWNNPLKFTDPSGEFFLGTLFNLLIRLPVAVFNTVINPTAIGDIWSDFGSSMINAIKIDIGGFKGGFWKTLSRWTWELPQTIIGKGYSHICNTIGQVENVDYWGGATVIKTKGNTIPIFPAFGVSLGSYIIGNNTIEADPANRLFQHEYGHYLQSQAAGWFYLSRYGIPSAFSKKPHWQHPVEQDANIRAFQYFSKHVPGFNWVDEYGDHNTLWSPHNPIIGYNWNLSPSDPLNQQALLSGRLGLAWYDFLLSPFNFTFAGIVVPGLLNALLLNNKY